jgi:hypothetical protein
MLLFRFLCLASAAAAAALKPVVRDYSDPSSPASQFRLAFNGPTGLTVSWNTPTSQDSPTVYYGTDPCELSGSASGTSTIYDTDNTWDNHVSISGLQPNTQYYYRVSSMSSDGYDPESMGFYFTTARAAGDDTPFSIAFFCDLGIVIGDLFDKYIPGTFASVLAARDNYEFICTPVTLAMLMTGSGKNSPELIL